jgi:hypothetical protein
MILRITNAAVVGPQILRLSFNDGTVTTVDVRALMDGPIFEPLYDPVYFSKVELDATAGTVSWPNGADFAPEALRELPALKESTVA